MKRLMLVSAVVFALGLGFGASASAYVEPEDDCTVSCQEIANDCLAQTGNFALCRRIFRNCLDSCT